jgi:hypothetical protein
MNETHKIKVEHDIKELDEGKHYVFTLKDKGVLEDDGDDDDNLDILENQDFKKNKSEFLQHGNGNGSHPMNRYDEKKTNPKGFIINENNKIEENSESKLNIKLNFN